MSRVITFSRVFPAYHPRKGQPTFFVEKFFNSIDPYKKINVWNRGDLSFINEFVINDCNPKHHTIRAGNRWKVGDKFSPRVWSGKPYKSKMITIAPDIEIKKVWNFNMDIEGLFYLNGIGIDVTSGDFAENDGLDADDLLNWFPYGKKIFNGQVICWNEQINYSL